MTLIHQIQYDSYSSQIHLINKIILIVYYNSITLNY